MPRIRYEDWRPRGEAARDVVRAQDICAEYAAQGYDLTLRQLYYQFVARGYIPNSQKSYNRLGDIVSKARLAGFLDWDYIVDRARPHGSVAHWENPSVIVDAIARQFRVDKWADQPYRVEVWIEKEALAGVMERACRSLDVDWFACKGYVSSSAMWKAAQRFKDYYREEQAVVVIHLGDHDPSGIDMTRDIRTRLMDFVFQDYLNEYPELFPGDSVAVRDIVAQMTDDLGGREPLTVERIALNMDQVEEYDPPPNPAKMTDSRANDYVALYGDESWELDALDPATLGDLIRDAVGRYRDSDLYEERELVEDEHREMLRNVSARWEDVVTYLQGAS